MKLRLLVAMGVLIVIGAASVPFLRAERFRGRIQDALEQALHRKVDVRGQVRFSLWPGLGFSIENVEIHEDPAIGIEPFAYVAALNATMSLTALLHRQWEVSSILLDEPTVNLVKQDSGSWNIRPLLSRTSSSGLRSFPEIKVRSGRINLKFGDTKSVLYFMNADLDIKPGAGSELRMRFSVEPARTDRIAQSIGTLLGDGRYSWYANKPSVLDLNMDLERSALSEIVTLLGGRGAGMRGFLASKARIQGPLTDLKIDGNMRLEDIQRWDLLRGGSANAPLHYRGKLDFPAGELDLETLTEGTTAPMRVRLRGHALLDNASWGAIGQFNEIPVSDLRDVLQFMNVSLPDRVGLEGKLSGVLGYSPAHGLQGLLNIPEASVKTAASAFHLRGATFAMDGEQFRLLPARLDLGGDRTAEIEGTYSPAANSFTWRTGETMMPIQDLLASHRQLLGASIPLLDQLSKGSWRGTLRVEKLGDEAPQWNGQFGLEDVQMEVAGLSAPLEIASATAAIVKNRISLDDIKGRAGGLDFQASYRQELTAARPHRLKLTAEQVDVTALETLFLPTLKRSGGFLRSLSFRAQLPEWLRERHLEAQVHIDTLWIAEAWLGGLDGLLVWDGGHVELSNAEWQRDESSGSGKITLRLTKTEPEYSVTAEVRNLPWKGGEVEGEGVLASSGTGFSLIRAAKSSGKFIGRGLAFPPEGDFRSVAGTYEFSSARGTPVLKLSSIEVSSGQDVLTGQGVSETDGRLNVDLGNTRKKLRMAGTVWPFQLEMK